MNDTVATWLIPALISGVVSVGIAVYSIKASAKAAREQWQEERRRVSLDAVGLLKVELATNQRMLQEVHDKVMWQLSGMPEEQGFQLRIHFINEPMPTWFHHTWDSHRISLASVLTVDTIRRLTDYFSQLERLVDYQSTLKSKLPDKLDTDYQAWKKAFDARQNSMQSFDEAGELRDNVRQYLETTRDTWKDCFSTMTALLAWHDALLEIKETPQSKPSPWWTRIRVRLPNIKVMWPRQIKPT